MSSSVRGSGGGENLKEEVMAQPPLVQDILDLLVGKVEGANITPETVVRGFRGFNGRELVEGGLDPNSLKQGQYVWKKYDSQPLTITWKVANGASPYILEAYSSQVDLTKVEASWFAGIKGVWNSTGYYEFPNANTFRIFDGNNTYDFAATWYASSSEFRVVSTTGIGNTSQFTDYVSDAHLLNYVTSDVETDYPAYGEQGGYWYERETGLTTLTAALGYTKAAVDKFTLSATQSNPSIPHSLGITPKFVLVVTPKETRLFSKYDVMHLLILNDKSRMGSSAGNSGIEIAIQSLGSGYGYSSSTGAYTIVTNAPSTMVLNGSFKAGVEYALITMA